MIKNKNQANNYHHQQYSLSVIGVEKNLIQL